MMSDDEASRDQRDVPRARPARVEVVIDETVAAAIAAHAACTVTGVARLEPGLSGLVTHLAARARHQLRQDGAGGPPPTEGVDVEVDGSTARVHVDLATAADAQATAVAHRVQDAIAQALLVDAGLTVTTVSVSVLDIDQPREGDAAAPAGQSR